MTNIKLYACWIYVIILIKLYQTKRVNLRRKGYTSIPYLEIPVDVTHLNLRYNLITMLNRNAFKNYSSLAKLDVSSNRINNIHDSAFNGLIRLKHLILYSNALSKVPFLGDISENIEELHLANNENIKTVNFSGTELPKLTKLDLHKTGLSHMPHFVSNAPNLKVLYLYQNSLTTIPGLYFKHLYDLEILDVSRNQLTELNPFTMGISRSLKQLKAFTNNIIGLSDGSFRNMTNLERLELYSNRITEFNVESLSGYHGFPNLKYLYLKGNRLHFAANISFHLMANLEELQLTNTSLKEVPILKANQTKLTHLYLDINQIANVSNTFFENLPFIRYLNLNTNQLKYFRIPTPGLSELQGLHLAKNQLQEFPDIKSSIKTIRRLNVGNNKIRNISMESVYGSSVPNMTAEALTNLYLHTNNMVNGTIDDRLWPTMPKLKYLQIYNMHLQLFPDLQALKELLWLDADNNDFTSIGNIEKLEQNKKLTYIFLYNNDLISVIDFAYLAVSYTSSSLSVYLGRNKLICNVDLCWMKYMSW